MLVIARDKNIIILAIQSAEDKHVITRALLEDEREKKRERSGIKWRKLMSCI